jgi:hypothetical protein
MLFRLFYSCFFLQNQKFNLLGMDIPSEVLNVYVRMRKRSNASKTLTSDSILNVNPQFDERFI